MEILSNKRRTILIVIMYAAALLLGLGIYELDSGSISESRSFLSKYSGIMATSLMVIGCFWELYLVKGKTSS